MAENTIPNQERWLPVVGYEGLYEVSDMGRVKSVARVIQRKGGRVNPIPEKILKPVMCRRYPGVSLYRAGSPLKTPTIHTLVMTAFVGPCPEGIQVAHNNGDRTDNRLENLRYATPLENSGDKFEHGTVLRGEQIARAKLTEECVREIRRLYQTGAFSQQDIADKFGVVQSAVSAVLIGKTWAHVE